MRGKVTDQNGETVIGATIIFKADPSVGTITDFDGDYNIDIPTSDPVVLVISSIGLTTVERTVNPIAGKVVILNIDLKSKDYNIGEVVIEAKANRSGDYFMEKIKKNSATSIDYISAETMRKVGDSQVLAAIQRVSGVSSVNGFITVRGLGDRYIATSINGMLMPTLDPFTNNIDLNIFPSGLVDNLVITKTGSPDLPGDWSGAFISLETKDFPDKLFVQFSAQLGINSNATFNEIVTSEGSDTDWLGFDNGYRDIPDGVGQVPDEFPTAFGQGAPLYEQFRILGLEPYLSGLGITDQTRIDQGDAFYQLALIELGYLGAAQYGNPDAIASAMLNYQEDYPDAYFISILNQPLLAAVGKFNEDVLTTRRTAPMNQQYSFTIGNQTKLFKKDFGFIAGFRYATDTRSDNDAEFHRINGDPRVRNDFNPDESTAAISLRDQVVQASRESVNLSALLSGSYKLNANNDLTLIFMPNFLGQNDAFIGRGRQENETGNFEWVDRQTYQERRQLVYQFRSNHYIPSFAGKVNIDVSYTDGRRNDPDFRNVSTNAPIPQPFVIVDGDTIARPVTQEIIESLQREWSGNEGLNRLYRTLDEDLLHAKASVEIPFDRDVRSLGKVKIGGSFVQTKRENLQRSYRLGLVGDIPDLENPFSQNPVGLNPNGTVSRNYSLLSSTLDRDIGEKKITSVFAMADYNFTTRIRIVGGLRVEYTDMFSDIYEFYIRDVPPRDSLRSTAGRLNAFRSDIEQVDYLPSINFIYKLKENEENPINLRLNYFSSIARPNLREISTIALEDFILQADVKGNPDLQTTQINNFDARLECFFKNNNNISFSAFYKNFQDHIELVEQSQDVFTWENAAESYAYGVELEGQYTIYKGLSLRGNLSFIQSRTTALVPIKTTRQMFGQAPYIINMILSYDWEKIGLISTISYNRQGAKLALVTVLADAPDIFEIPRDRVDLKFTKSIADHLSAGFSVRDLFNTADRRAYDFDRGYLLDFDSYNWGTNYNFSITYTL